MPFNGSDPQAHIASCRLEYPDIVDRIPDFPIYSDDQMFLPIMLKATEGMINLRC
jgi:hypothetical protein